MTAWLLTWFLQGGVIAAGVAVALRCAPRRNAATRHLIWFSALAALAWLGWATSPFRSAPTSIAFTQAADPIYIPSAPDVLVSAVLGIWAAIALMRLLRILAGLRALYTMRDACRPFPSSIEARLPLWLEAKTCGRHTELMTCDRVSGATVLGFQRPCIAIPAVLLDALTADELDQVILHEHAHVQRRDDWARLAQMLLMSVLWINPAASFVSRALNREREMACDEWVVARTGLPKAYARCLAHAAEVRVRLGRRPILLPTLIGTRRELVERVDRVLGMGNGAKPKASIVAAGATVCAMALISVQLQTVRGFSEIADIFLPHVSRPVLSFHSVPSSAPPAWALLDAPVATNAPTTSGAPDPPVARTEPAALIEAIAPFSSTAPTAPVSPVPPASGNLPGRTFAGAYPLPQERVFASASQASRWRSMTAPGLEIASAAKKTSVGLADALGRAGVGLARRF